MAKNATIETAETALPDSDTAGQRGSPSAGYVELIDWIKEREELDETVRVAAIVTTDANAPDYERLKYSYPAVKLGKVDGYERSDGSLIIKPD